MDENSHKHCSNCGKSTTRICTRCKASYYCDVTCQKAHLPEHKKTCGKTELEKKIYRAGAVFQDVFFTLREKTFDEVIVKIEEVGNTLIIYKNEDGARGFTTFPEHLIANDMVKQMVLSMLKCMEPIGYLADFLAEMLEGIDTKIHDCHILLKPPKRKIKVVTADGRLIIDPPPIHDVLRITVSGVDKEYIFDAAGAQLGIFDPCTELDTYWNKYIERPEETVPFGSIKKMYQQVRFQQGGYGLSARRTWDAVKVLHTAVRHWKEKSGLTLSTLLSQPDHLFRKHEQDLLSTIRDALAAFVSSADYRADIAATNVYERHNPGFTDQLMFEACIDMVTSAGTDISWPGDPTRNRPTQH